MAAIAFVLVLMNHLDWENTSLVTRNNAKINPNRTILRRQARKASSVELSFAVAMGEVVLLSTARVVFRIASAPLDARQLLPPACQYWNRDTSASFTVLEIHSSSLAAQS
jgi:hypothetical protein